MMTVARTGRRTQISASFCMINSFFPRLWALGSGLLALGSWAARGARLPRAKSPEPRAAFLELRFNPREQSRPQPSIRIRKLCLGEHRPGGRVDHSPDGFDRS